MLLFIACDNGSDDDPENNSELLPMMFPNNFTPPNDYLSGNPLDGWGGGQGTITHTPIVFVHGNGHTANNWITMASYFAEAGYSWNELWAISYIEVIQDPQYNTNEGNWSEIDAFVQAVIDYTGAEKVNIISHSLGVTVARTWLKYTNDYNQIKSFIGIAGANHGVNFCGPNIHIGLCGEIGHPESDFLNWLNGDDETPVDDILWISIYNGTDLDSFFRSNSVMNDSTIYDLRESPVLEGAFNIQLPELDHFQIALSITTFDTIVNYVE